MNTFSQLTKTKTLLVSLVNLTITKVRETIHTITITKSGCYSHTKRILTLGFDSFNKTLIIMGTFNDVKLSEI